MERDNQAITAFKLWIFPSLVSIMSLMIWQEIKEIKSDVKALLSQSNIDKTRIDNLERHLFKPVTIPGPTSRASQNQGDQVPPPPIKLMLTEFLLPGKNEFDEEMT